MCGPDDSSTHDFLQHREPLLAERIYKHVTGKASHQGVQKGWHFGAKHVKYRQLVHHSGARWLWRRSCVSGQTLCLEAPTLVTLVTQISRSTNHALRVARILKHRQHKNTSTKRLHLFILTPKLCRNCMIYNYHCFILTAIKLVSLTCSCRCENLLPGLNWKVNVNRKLQSQQEYTVDLLITFTISTGIVAAYWTVCTVAVRDMWVGPK